VEQPALRILNTNRIMAISTVRPDGWPQTTVVGYVNRGFEIFFLIFRSGQKYSNIAKDDRVSVAIAPEPDRLEDLKAVYAGGHASEILDAGERDEVWRLLLERDSNLAGFKMPEATKAAFMRLKCKYVSVLDFGEGIGHSEQLIIDEDGVALDIGAGLGDLATVGAGAAG
jgi:nitroimidazol reductase NimA-like FMN-containing flavoprotein (pyridoxamine 5'-phosphate oxidase superfamily)